MKTTLAALLAFSFVAVSASAQEEDSIARIQKEFQAAGQADDKIDEQEMKEFAGRALALAKTKGGRVGFQGCLWTFYVTRTADFSILPEVKKPFRDGAMDVVIENYVDSSGMKEIIDQFEGFRPEELTHFRGYLDRIIAATKKEEIKTHAEARKISILKRSMDSPMSDSERKDVAAALETWVKAHGDEADPTDWQKPKRTYAQTLAGPIFELKNLYVGAIAPDIEGEDLDGTTFKLSDYRGKVVMLDFWGHW